MDQEVGWEGEADGAGDHGSRCREGRALGRALQMGVRVSGSTSHKPDKRGNGNSTGSAPPQKLTPCQRLPTEERVLAKDRVPAQTHKALKESVRATSSEDKGGDGIFQGFLWMA